MGKASGGVLGSSSHPPTAPRLAVHGFGPKFRLAGVARGWAET